MSQCPAEEVLARFVDGQSSDLERTEVESHLDGCADCRLVISSALSQGVDAAGETRPARPGAVATTRRRAEQGDPPRGTLIGRYVVLDRLGSGGMGTVYAAFDPVLDRRVALKLLRPDVFGDDGQELLLREAKVLASFGHPNVLAVHDSGAWEGRVFLAMELVEGGTLRDWARAEPRTWQEVVAMMISVGQGLAAAHRAGFVHRDFKPENVLVGHDGRPRVTDFGLAVRAHGSSLEDTGSGRGTPLYMAPEQMEGAAPDARSDIFAFSVTLHQLLYGVRPFAGETIGDLHRAIRANEVVEPPRERIVPAWLRALVLRGLRANHDERPASMDAVLSVLRSDPGRRRQRMLGAAALLLLAVVVGVVGERVAAQRQASCVAEGTLLDGVWNASRRSAIEQAFQRTGLAWAPRTFETTVKMLDEYARAWSAMRVQVCEATRVERRQPEEVMALRVACLDDRRRELDALATVLAGADRTAVEQARNAAGALTPISDCADVKELAQPVPRPRDPAIRKKLDDLQGRIAEANARVRTGHPAQGYQVGREVLEELKPIDYAPGLANAYYLMASCAHRLGKPDEALELAKDALIQAQRGRDDSIVLTSLGLLSQIAGLYLGRTEEGLFYSRMAFASLARKDNVDPYDVSQLRGYRAVVYSAAGRHEEALADNIEAWKQVERIYGPNHLWTIEARTNLGVVLFNMGRIAEAETHFEAATRALEQAVGPGSPEVLPAQSNLGFALLTLGRIKEAAPIIEAVVEYSRIAYGEQGSQWAISAINLGELRILQRRFDEAIAIEKKVIAILEPLGVEPTALCEPLTQIALAELLAGRAADALPPVERALTIGVEHHLSPVELAKVQLAAARVHRALGHDPDKVRALATSARAAWADVAHRFGGENQQRVDEIDAFLAGK